MVQIYAGLKQNSKVKNKLTFTKLIYSVVDERNYNFKKKRILNVYQLLFKSIRN